MINYVLERRRIWCVYVVAGVVGGESDLGAIAFPLCGGHLKVFESFRTILKVHVPDIDSVRRESRNRRAHNVVEGCHESARRRR